MYYEKAKMYLQDVPFPVPRQDRDAPPSPLLHQVVHNIINVKSYISLKNQQCPLYQYLRDPLWSTLQ